MANIREINRKIVSLRNMQKVMRAMQMIASIKLHKLSRLQNPLKIFSSSLDMIFNHIKSSFQNFDNPVINGYKKVEKAHLILFTGDRGLCGLHNSSVQKAAAICFGKNRREGIKTGVTCIGKKGVQFCKNKGYTIFYQTEIHEENLIKTSIKQLAHTIVQRFSKGELHRITIIYNHFVSMIHQDTLTVQVLPLTVPGKSDGIKKKTVTCTEPAPENFLMKAMELYLFYTLQVSLINSLISEQAARMTAMENSSNNSENLIYHYNRIRNRARQDAITNEMIEIISGKEAMKR